eukprot:5851644-Ditylum_brightwellii.AAC.1
MKLAIAALLFASASAFAPSARFAAPRTAMHMSTEAAEETKVRVQWRIVPLKDESGKYSSWSALFLAQGINDI